MAGMLKLSRRLATWLTFGMLVAIPGLIFIGGGGVDPVALLAFPAAYDNVVGFVLTLGGLLALVYGAAIAGSEWTWRTLKSAVARGESRSLYILATFAAVAAVYAIAIVLAVAFGVLAAVVGGAIAGISADGIGDATALATLPDKLARVWVAIVGVGALGFAIATLTRSQLAGIGVGVGVYVGGTFAANLLPDIVKYLPFSAADAVLAASRVRSPASEAAQLPTLEPNIALLVVVAWLVGALIVAALFTERAEIAG